METQSPCGLCFPVSQLSLSEAKHWLITGRGAFTTALELQEQQRLVLSFMHHMAAQRLCKNPFEDESVVGITNYINIGLQASFSAS